MRFLHLADLHLGKRLRDVSFLEDQQYVLRQIVDYAAEYTVDAVLIAGDIYQSATPSAEAMALFDWFLQQLTQQNIKIFMISGNHDSDARISYFSALIRKAGVYTSAQFEGKLQQITLTDAYGEYTVSLLPFCKPIHVRLCYPEEDILTYEDAIRCVLAHSPIDTTKRNLLLCHQCILGCEQSDSELHAVGGLDHISAELFTEFDYVALGHLHKPQSVLRPTIRYAGSLLKYSFSEVHTPKRVPLIEMGAKGNVTVNLLPLAPLHEMRIVEGLLNEVLQQPYSEDYVQMILHDETVSPDAASLLQTVFPNMMYMKIENSRTSDTFDVLAKERQEEKTIEELFCDFYALQNNDCQPSSAQRTLLRTYIKQLLEEEA